jgi:hypothetical protein
MEEIIQRGSKDVLMRQGSPKPMSTKNRRRSWTRTMKRRKKRNYDSRDGCKEDESVGQQEER